MADPGQSELLAQFQNMTPQDRARFRAVLNQGAQDRGGGTPKFSSALDQVDDSELTAVIGAADEGLQIVKDGGGDPLEPLRTVAPDVAAAAAANSSYRRKDLAHSIRVVKQYLEERQGDHDDADDGEEHPAEEGAPPRPRRRKARRR